MELSFLSRQILRDLCTNSRITVSDLSKKYNITWHSIKGRIKALEDEYGLLYTLELNYEALGMTTMHVVNIKCTKKPKIEELMEICKKSKNVQLAVTTKGDCDIVIFALAEAPRAYYMWEISLMISLAKYGVSINSSEVTLPHIGFVPLNDELIKNSQIDEVYKKLILELNKNSRMTIRELGKKVGLKENITRYYLRKLEEEKAIKRFTAVVTRPPYKYNILYFTNYRVKEGVEKRVENERKMMYWKKHEEFPIINEFQLMFSMCGSENSLNWAIYGDLKKGLAESVELHKKIYSADSPTVIYAVVDRIVKGVLPIRNLDPKDSFDFSFSETTTPGTGTNQI